MIPALIDRSRLFISHRLSTGRAVSSPLPSWPRFPPPPSAGGGGGEPFRLPAPPMPPQKKSPRRIRKPFFVHIASSTCRLSRTHNDRTRRHFDHAVVEQVSNLRA